MGRDRFRYGVDDVLAHKMLGNCRRRGSRARESLAPGPITHEWLSMFSLYGANRSDRVRWMNRLLPVVGLVCIFQATGWAAPTQRPALVVTQIPNDGGALPEPARPSALQKLPSGSRIVVSRHEGDGRQVAVISSGFDAAGHPCVSHDAERVLFVGRQTPGSPDSVWEVKLDGTGLHEVIAPPGGADRAIYLSTLYTMQSARPTPRIAYRAVGCAGRPQLFACASDGTDARPITFAPGGVVAPMILSDGRLLFGMRGGGEGETTTPSVRLNKDGKEEPRLVPPEHRGEGSGARDATSWFTIQFDGTDIFPFAAMHEPVRVHGSPVETFDDRVMYLEGDVGRANGFDALVSVARTDSLTTRREIARVAAGGLYDLAAAPDGGVLVAARLREAASIGVYGMHGGTLDAQPVLDDPAWHAVDVAPVVVRPRPPGRSSVVVPTASTGKLYCLDVYLSNTDAGRRVEQGQVRRVRFLTPGAAATARTGAHGASRQPDPLADEVMGYLDVERDGSFAGELPARTPFRIESLDASGRVLQSMRSWMWVMPMERRGCIGCHEDRALTPPNRQVTALRKRIPRIGVTPDSGSQGGGG